MLEKSYKVLRVITQLSVSLFKAVAMAITPIKLLESLTGIPTNNLPEEIAKGNVKACIIGAAGLITVGSLLSYKYFQMAVPEKIEVSIIDEDALLVIDQNIDTEASDKCLYPKIFLHISSGITYTFLDILLQVYTVNHFLNDCKLDNTAFYLVSLPLNGIGAITVLLQDIRLMAAMLKDHSPGFKALSDDLKTFRESTPGIGIEVYATAYRTVASKMSLSLMIKNDDSLSFFSFLIFNPLTFYCKYSNNQTDLSESEFSSSAEKLRSLILAILFSVTYAIEDAALYVHTIEDVLKLNKFVTKILFGIVATLESVAYTPKSLHVAQSTINKISHYCAPKFSCWQNISFFSQSNTKKAISPFDDKSLVTDEKSISEGFLNIIPNRLMKI